MGNELGPFTDLAVTFISLAHMLTYSTYILHAPGFLFLAFIG